MGMFWQPFRHNRYAGDGRAATYRAQRVPMARSASTIRPADATSLALCHSDLPILVYFLLLTAAALVAGAIETYLADWCSSVKVCIVVKRLWSAMLDACDEKLD
eukprot:COSAG05_NODE_345_length_10977_cov_17.229178_3_plen_104_part_00